MYLKTHKIVTLGDINIDWIVNIDDVSKPVQSLWVEARNCITTKLGGAGAIFSIAANDSGFESYIIGKVGDDPYGEDCSTYLQRSGVNTTLTIDSKTDTGKIIILRDSNDKKAMISHRGANVNLRPEELNKNVIENCDILFISGYSLLEAPQSKSSIEAARIAKRSGAFVVLDVVPHRVFAIGLGRDYQECLSLADGLVLEAGTAKRMLNDQTAPVSKIIEGLLDSYRLVILRPDNNHQIIATHSYTERTSTGYCDAENKTGYLDKITAQLLFDFLQKS